MIKVEITGDRALHYYDTDLLGWVELVPLESTQEGRQVTVYEMVITAVPLKTMTECRAFIKILEQAMAMLHFLNTNERSQ